MEPNDIEEIKKLFVKWKSVQSYLKQTELYTHSAPIAAINELRYAGRIFSAATLMARDLENIFEIDDEIQKSSKSLSESILLTNQYLQNADHDISDSLVYYYSSILASISDSYSQNIEGVDHSKVNEARLIILESKKLIVDSRGDLAKRESNYESIKANMVRMEDLYPEIEKVPYKVAGKLKYESVFKANKTFEILSLIFSASIGALFSFLVL